MEYLNEAKLGEILKILFPNKDFIHDKAVPTSSNRRKRPDYRCDDLNLIVEFDGYGHYTVSKNIISDLDKDEDYNNLGYKVIRIPYFIQLTKEVIFDLFDIEIEEELYTYPHGFIDKKAILPADFCELGVKKFKDDLIKFSYIKDDIINSLSKQLEIKDINIVLPPSLSYLTRYRE